MNTKITATLPVYMNQKYGRIDPASLSTLADASEGDKATVITSLNLNSSEWIKEDGDYIPVGVAHVTLELAGVQDMVRGQVKALKAARKKVLAEAQRETNRIDDQISKLLALTFEA